MASPDQESMYLQLSPDPIRFEPVSRVTNVFFDGTTKEVVSVRGGGTLGVVVQGLNSKEAFCMEHRGNITSIKFATDHSRLAVQRTHHSLELLSFSKGKLGPGVTVECKTKNATLLGFVWADKDDLVLVTSHGIEFYHVSRERVFVRLSRSYSLSGCCWFVWSSECHTLVVATNVNTSPPGHVALYPFQFAANYSNKMPKCVVDLTESTSSNAPSNSDVSLSLNERDVCVAYVYRPALLVLQHPTQPTNSAKLLVYTHAKESSNFKLTHVCQLELSGSFAVNVIDSLIIVHHQLSKISMIFDIALGTEIRAGVCYVYPATKPASIRPYCLEESMVSTVTNAPSTGGTTAAAAAAAALTTKIPCQLYAPTWVVFQPSVIIDARLGCLWSLQLDLPAFAATFSDSLQLISCLLNRRHAKSLILRTVGKIAERRSLHTLGPVFDRINAGYRRHLNASSSLTGSSTLSTPTSAMLQPAKGPCNVLSNNVPVVVVESVDVYSSVLSPMMEQTQQLIKPSFHSISASPNSTIQFGYPCGSAPHRNKQKNTTEQHQNKTDDCENKEDNLETEKLCDQQRESFDDGISYLVSVTLEFVRSLSAAGLPVPDFLHQLVVNALLNAGHFFQLHQLLQYHVIPDSKPLACVLLSRAGVYPACEQLSLDMLSRLRSSHEEIIEVLLANNLITQALRYARSNGLEETLSCRKFLEAALQCGDEKIFYSTFTLFALRNSRLGNCRTFGEGDHCEVYVRHYKKLFGALPDYYSVTVL